MLWLEKTKQIHTLILHFMNCLCLCKNPRSGENKMDSSNLAVMLAPNLLHSGDAADKMNANMEKRLKLQAAVVHCLIENARNFGTNPDWRNTRVSCAAFCAVSRRLFPSLFLRGVAAVTSGEGSGNAGLRRWASVPISR